MYPMRKGGYMPGPHHFGYKFNKGGFNRQYYPTFKKVPIVKKVPIYRKVPVYKKVIIDKPVYVPVYKDVPVPKPRKLNQQAWNSGSQGPLGGAISGGAFPGGFDLGAPNLDLGFDLGGGNLDMNIGGPDLGEFRAPGIQQAPADTHAVVTSNIQITDADHVTTNSNTNSANSQSHSLAVNSNIGIHDADAVNLGSNTGVGFGGASGADMSQFGLEAGALGGANAAALDLASLLGPQGLDPAVGGQGGSMGLGVGDALGGSLGGMGHDPFGAGGGHADPLGGGFNQGLTGGQGGAGTSDAHLAGILAGLGAAGQDQLATAATHQGQHGMLAGEPVAIVSMTDRGHGGGVGHGPSHLGVHGGHGGMGHSAGGGHGGHV